MVACLFIFGCVFLSAVVYEAAAQDPCEQDVGFVPQKMEVPVIDRENEPSKDVVIKHIVVVTPSPGTTPAPSPLRTRVVVVHNDMVPVPIECFLPSDPGTCAKDMIRVYYDHHTRTCKPFSYTGCGGNANRFFSVKNCYRICHPYRYKVKPKVVKLTTRSPPRSLPQPCKRKKSRQVAPPMPQQQQQRMQPPCGPQGGGGGGGGMYQWGGGGQQFSGRGSYPWMMPQSQPLYQRSPAQNPYGGPGG